MDIEGYYRVAGAIPTWRGVGISPAPGHEEFADKKEVRFVTLITRTYPGIILSELESAGVLFDANAQSDSKPQLRLIENLTKPGQLTFEDMAYRRPNPTTGKEHNSPK